jgi:competence protein ComEA
MNWIRELWEENGRRIIIALVGILLILVGIFWYGFEQLQLKSENNLKLTQTSSSRRASSLQTKKKLSASSSTDKTLYVDIKGAVKNPGVYPANNQQRVNDIVMAAGGLLKQADQNQVNLSLKLQDQQIIYVPFKGESATEKLPTTVDQSPTTTSTSVATTSQDQTAASSQTTSKINLNSVTKEQLMQINGIGEKKADLIISYRQEHGQFKQMEELKDISGIGDKTYEVLKESLTLE